MTKAIVKIAAVAALAAATIFAQGPAGRGRMGQRGVAAALSPGAGAGQAYEPRVLGTLSLTEAQKEQIKSINQAARQSAKLLQPDLQLQRQALAEGVKLNDAARMKQASLALGALQGQSELIWATARANVYALLTADQKTKLDQVQGKLRRAAQAARQALQ